MIGKLPEIIERGKIADENGELVAADPRQEGIFRQNVDQRSRGGLQQPVAGVMADDIIDGGEAIKPDMQQRQLGEVWKNGDFRQSAVEETTIGQAGEIVVIGGMLHTGRGFGKFGGAQFGYLFLGGKFVGEKHIRGHVPFGADENAAPLLLEIMGARAQVADGAIRQHDPIFGRIIALGSDGAGEIRLRPGKIAGMNGIVPQRRLDRATGIVATIKAKHLRIPDQFFRQEVVLPHADHRSVERKLQPTNQTLEFLFRTNGFHHRLYGSCISFR